MLFSLIVIANLLMKSGHSFENLLPNYFKGQTRSL